MSYQSAQDPRLHFGLGQRSMVDSVEIMWPSGTVTRLVQLKSDQIVAVKEGVGIVERPFPRVSSLKAQGPSTRTLLETSDRARSG